MSTVYCVECGGLQPTACGRPIGATVQLATGEPLFWCSPACLERTVQRSRTGGAPAGPRRASNPIVGRLSLVDCPSCDGGREYPGHNCEGCLGTGKVEWDRTMVSADRVRIFKPGLADQRRIARRW